MDASRQEKQQYLVSQIIDRGYDPEQFQQFLIQKLGSMVDLDCWTFPNLKKAVLQFHQIKENPHNINESPEKIRLEKRESDEDDDRVRQQTTVQTKQIRSDVLEESGQYLEFNYQTKQQTFSQMIDCQKIPPNQLLSKNVQIKISKFIKKEGGIFQQSYVTYIVETPCLGKVVDRRYNDFLWLKTTLEYLHPGLPIPPIAKKGQYRRYDDKHLYKRLLILQMFLNKLVQIPQIKGDQIIENFLKFDDTVMFEKFKSDHKRNATVPISQVKNIKGHLNAGIDPKINHFLVKTQRNLMETQPLMKRLYKQFKAAATLLESCKQVMGTISKICYELDEKDKAFRKETQLKYCNSNTYTILMESAQNYGKLMERQASTFRRQLYGCLKYESLNMINMLDSFDKLKGYQHQYHEAKNSLFRRKQRLYEEGNMSKWGLSQVPNKKPQKMEAIKIILPRETDDLGKLRIKYGLRNFQTYEECSRHFTKNNIYLSKNLMKYVKFQSNITSQLMMVWVDAQTRVLSMEEGKSIQDVEFIP